MKKITRTLTSLTALALCLAIFVSCNGGKGAHTHDNCAWVIGPDGHYQSCADENTKINDGEHTLDNDNICSICGAYVAASSPTETKVTVYDSFGNVKSRIVYRNSMPVMEELFTYEMKDGAPVSYKSYIDGALAEEGKLTPSKNGEYRTSEKKEYYFDSSYSVSIYDDKGNKTSEIYYKNDGSVDTELRYENTYGNDGALLNRVRYSDGKKNYEATYVSTGNGESRNTTTTYYYDDGSRSVCTLNELLYTISEVVYDKDGNITVTDTYEYSYDGDGNILSEKHYRDSVLMNECEYGYVSYKYARRKTEMVKSTYHSDLGDKDVYVYQNGTVISNTEYDNTGNKIREYTYKYTYDKYGEIEIRTAFMDGKLQYEYEYLYCTGSIYDKYRSCYTHYNSDGSKSVELFDEAEMTVSVVRYDSEGKEIGTYTYDRTYDDYGHIMYEKEYENGILIYEEEYSYRDGSTSTYRSMSIEYCDDSTKEVTRYNDHNDTTSEITYDSDGNIIDDYKYIYEYDESGEKLSKIEYHNDVMKSKIEYKSDETIHVTSYYEDRTEYTIYSVEGDSPYQRVEYPDSSKIEYFYNAHGHIARKLEYDTSGNIKADRSYDNTYDEDGIRISQKEYLAGKIVSVYEFTRQEDDPDSTYMSKATFYYENATQVLEYDDCGDIVSQIEYNTDGSVHYSHTYDIVRDDNGHVIRQKKYINGKLCTEREYSYSEDGYGTYTSKRTEYTSDRIEYTIEYDENGNIISEIHYDEEGNIIE